MGKGEGEMCGVVVPREACEGERIVFTNPPHTLHTPQLGLSCVKHDLHVWLVPCQLWAKHVAKHCNEASPGCDRCAQR